MKIRKTRARGTGSVRPFRGGRFVGRVSLGKDPIDGKRIQRTKYFDTDKEAKSWVAGELYKFENGEEARRIRDRQSLGEFLTDYYANDRRGLKGKRLSLRTCAADMECVKHYLITRAPAVANTPLPKLKTEQLSRLFRHLADGDETHDALARATVSRLYRILRARLGHAVKLGKLRGNPMRPDLIPVDGKAAREHRTLSPEQTQALLAVCSTDRFGPLFEIIGWTGLRPGEAAGITWPDIDFENHVLTVRRALVRNAGTWELRETKTGRARRVPIPVSLVQSLQAHRRLQAHERLAAGPEYSDHGLVFANVFGEPVHLDLLVARHFKPLLRRAAVHLAGMSPVSMPAPSRSAAYRAALDAQGAQFKAAILQTAFPMISLYELRHTQATLLLRRGVHPKMVADRMGHSKTSTTLDIYSHITPDMQDGVLDVLTKDLQPTPGRRPA